MDEEYDVIVLGTGLKVKNSNTSCKNTSIHPKTHCFVVTKFAKKAFLSHRHDDGRKAG